MQPRCEQTFGWSLKKVGFIQYGGEINIFQYERKWWACDLFVVNNSTAESSKKIL